MKTFTAKKIAILLAVSLVLSLGIVRWNTIDNVPFCHYSAGCQPDVEPQGKITVRNYGYPLEYRQVQIFEPANDNENSPDYAGYAETRVENLQFSLPSLLMNIVFWFALLHLLAQFIKPKDSKKDDAQTEQGATVAKES